MAITNVAHIPLPIRRMAAARHEAGHVVTAIYVGRKVTGAILRAPHGLSGETQFEKAPDVELDMSVKANRNLIQDELAMLMSGNVAELAFWRKLSHIYDPYVDSHRDDEKEIKRLSDGYPLNDVGRAELLRHCRERAEKILNLPGRPDIITDISIILANNFTIDRPTIDSVFRKHIPAE